ncbi:OMP_b-brl domain-containing protein [Vibrio chagasii]|uniref:porin family protein n=1 Tax=Vibrio TaxID=662 RepID=UPI00228387A0|nr:MULTISPECIES: porin family protein [Vibrio]MCY9826189.1 porin family protein [Vibrio chagasii]MDA0153770.1 porin family protein [Vibrio sp. Makdt]CAH6826988.1 OMP_b-brl domain-containing protein [Vibrio chagasii]CAH6869356.1 OMP_b-brl domain-containing protein [Vibrio chagasii]CAH6916258.1 OMP_b-brl domain-containing protein [Vibrio chagasii]
MKSSMVALSLLSIFAMSSQAVASDKEASSKELGQFYVGADIGFYNETEFEFPNDAIEDSSDLSDLSYNLVGGYEFNTHDVVKLGLEAEYRKIGKVSYSDSMDIEGQAFFVNVKPKFIVKGDALDLYVSLLAGVGSMDMDVKMSGTSESKSEAAYQVGAELGAIVSDNIDIHLGYRNARVEIYDVDVSSQTAYIGARYKF